LCQGCRPPELGGQPIDERALACAGRTGHADEIRAAGAAKQRAEKLDACRIFVFDQGNGARDGPGSPATMRSASVVKRASAGQSRALDFAGALSDGRQLHVAKELLAG